MENQVKNLALIGFMGSGKSAVGRLLARELGLSFVDTDAEIEKKEGVLIRKIWKEKGEDHFRQIESAVIKEVTERKHQIIACGGGAVLRPQNAKLLKHNSLVVYLKATSDQLYQRLKYASNRPLLKVSDVKTEIGKLLAAREGIYEQVADIIIDTTKLTTREVAELILTKLKEKGESIPNAE